MIFSGISKTKYLWSFCNGFEKFGFPRVCWNTWNFGYQGVSEGIADMQHCWPYLACCVTNFIIGCIWTWYILVVMIMIISCSGDSYLSSVVYPLSAVYSILFRMEALGSQYLCFPNLWFPNSVLFVANNVLRVSKCHGSLSPIPKFWVLQNLIAWLNDHCNRQKICIVLALGHLHHRWGIVVVQCVRLSIRLSIPNKVAALTP